MAPGSVGGPNRQRSVREHAWRCERRT